MNILQVAGPAIGAGLLHVILGPDHMAAIMTVSACQGSAALWYGIRWGVGHSFGLILVALILWTIDADTDISRAAFTKYASYFSGAFMILFGLYFVRDIIVNDKSGRGFTALGSTEMVGITPPVEGPEELDKCSDDEESNERTSLSPTISAGLRIPPQTNKSAIDEPEQGSTWYQAAASFFAGIVGGVAGPGGVLAIVPASYYHTRIEAIAYILSFIIASTACMGLFAYIYGRVTAKMVTSAVDAKRQETKLKLVSAIASIVVGGLWILLTALNVIDLD